MSKYVGETAVTYFLSGVIIIALIFLVCALIDMIRQHLFNALKLIPLCAAIDNRVVKFLNAFIEKRI